jgi:hypothetical protein
VHEAAAGGSGTRRNTVKVFRSIQIGTAVLAVGMTLTAVAQAGSNGAVQRAEAIRSRALNDKYNVDALNALRIRSDALNRRYHLGKYATSSSTDNAAARQAEAIRAQAMNQRYHLGSYAVVRQSSGFDWVDASVGGAAVFGLFLIGGGVAVGMRRFRGERLTPA